MKLFTKNPKIEELEKKVTLSAEINGSRFSLVEYDDASPIANEFSVKPYYLKSGRAYLFRIDTPSMPETYFMIYRRYLGTSLQDWINTGSKAMEFTANIIVFDDRIAAALTNFINIWADFSTWAVEIIAQYGMPSEGGFYLNPYRANWINNKKDAQIEQLLKPSQVLTWPKTRTQKRPFLFSKFEEINRQYANKENFMQITKADKEKMAEIDNLIAPYADVAKIDWTSFSAQYKVASSGKWEALGSIPNLARRKIPKDKAERERFLALVNGILSKRSMNKVLTNPQFNDFCRMVTTEALLQQTPELTANWFTDRLVGVYPIDNDWNLVLSNDPLDVYQKSNNQYFAKTSCERYNSIHSDGFYYDVIYNNMVAFIQSTHTGVNVGRIMVRWCNNEGNVSIGTEPIWYMSKTYFVMYQLPTKPIDIRLFPKSDEGKKCVDPEEIEQIQTSSNTFLCKYLIINQQGKIYSPEDMKKIIYDIVANKGVDTSYYRCSTLVYRGYTDRGHTSNAVIHYTSPSFSSVPLAERIMRVKKCQNCGGWLFWVARFNNNNTMNREIHQYKSADGQYLTIDGENFGLHMVEFNIDQKGLIAPSPRDIWEQKEPVFCTICKTPYMGILMNEKMLTIDLNQIDEFKNIPPPEIMWSMFDHKKRMIEAPVKIAPAPNRSEIGQAKEGVFLVWQTKQPAAEVSSFMKYYLFQAFKPIHDALLQNKLDVISHIICPNCKTTASLIYRTDDLETPSIAFFDTWNTSIETFVITLGDRRYGFNNTLHFRPRNSEHVFIFENHEHECRFCGANLLTYPADFEIANKCLSNQYFRNPFSDGRFPLFQAMREVWERLDSLTFPIGDSIHLYQKVNTMAISPNGSAYSIQKFLNENAEFKKRMADFTLNAVLHEIAWRKLIDQDLLYNEINWYVAQPNQIIALSVDQLTPLFTQRKKDLPLGLKSIQGFTQDTTSRVEKFLEFLNANPQKLSPNYLYVSANTPYDLYLAYNYLLDRVVLWGLRDNVFSTIATEEMGRFKTHADILQWLEETLAQKVTVDFIPKEDSS